MTEGRRRRRLKAAVLARVRRRVALKLRAARVWVEGTPGGGGRVACLGVWATPLGCTRGGTAWDSSSSGRPQRKVADDRQGPPVSDRERGSERGQTQALWGRAGPRLAGCAGQKKSHA
jgi:hypothetical protein